MGPLGLTDLDRVVTIGLGALMGIFALGIVLASYWMGKGHADMADLFFGAIFAGVAIALLRSARARRPLA